MELLPLDELQALEETRACKVKVRYLSVGAGETTAEIEETRPPQDRGGKTNATGRFILTAGNWK
jgi:hypothetical protein